jgi:hypothetical protein
MMLERTLRCLGSEIASESQLGRKWLVDLHSAVDLSSLLVYPVEYS